jgi:2-methylisocitrate lyase-like PEP mutase family enzyme
MVSSIFHDMHIKGDPLILYNVWDAGSAQAVTQAEAKAIATGSWSVAAADGYQDGEAIPLDRVIANIERITANTNLPVSLDFEGGYTNDNKELAENIEKLLALNIAGINFEDQEVGSDNIYTPDHQSQRIKTIRDTADRASKPLFINARTDLFLKEKDQGKHHALLANAIERSKAYHAAGANGFFAPALTDPALIKELCDESPLPVNIMMGANTPDIDTLKTLGVARISYGPKPYLDLMATLTERATAALAGN